MKCLAAGFVIGATIAYFMCPKARPASVGFVTHVNGAWEIKPDAFAGLWVA